MKKVSMENDRRAIGHFKTVCECSEQTARLFFSDVVNTGVPICSECGVDMELVGVEINQK